MSSKCLNNTFREMERLTQKAEKLLHRCVSVLIHSTYIRVLSYLSIKLTTRSND